MLNNSSSLNLDDIKKYLQTLPDAFPDYNHSMSFPSMPRELEDMYACTHKLPTPQEAINNIEKIITEVNKFPKSNYLFLTRAYFALGEIYGRSLNNFKTAVSYYEKCIEAALNCTNLFKIEECYSAIAWLHQQYFNTLDSYEESQRLKLIESLTLQNSKNEISARIALATIDTLKTNTCQAIANYSKAYMLSQGEIDYEAYRIGQKEIGLSNNEKIGTDNINQCVAVILYDRSETKNALLVHVDKETSIESLEETLTKFVKTISNPECHLVGGTDTTFDHKTSEDNINKVLNALSKIGKSINIVTANIGMKGAPRAIVFDPKVGKLKHAVPGGYQPKQFLREMRLQCPPFSGDLNLNIGLDLITSELENSANSYHNIVPIQYKWYQALVIRKYINSFNTLISNYPCSRSWTSNICLKPVMETIEYLYDKYTSTFLEIYVKETACWAMSPPLPNVKFESNAIKIPPVLYTNYENEIVI